MTSNQYEALVQSTCSSLFMVKGMQPSRCLAILGETLRPIPASRIYGGVK